MTVDNKIDYLTQIKNIPNLSLYAPLASPALTGNPTAPTPAVSDNDTSIATTAFVMAQRGDIPSGATLPASPLANQLFMHTPTGRRVLMLYTGSAWYPLYSFGTMTVYVNYTSGTDAADKGTGTGTNAYKTLSYMWTQLPSIYYGNIVINVSGETYNETLTCQGKRPGGAYTITITGALETVDTGTMSAGVQGSGTTPGSITDSSKSWTINAMRGMFVAYSGGSGRVIDTNSGDTLISASYFGGTPSGAYEIYKPATILSALSVSNGQNITVYNINIGSNASTSIIATSKSELTLFFCQNSPTGTANPNGLWCKDGATVSINYSSLKQTTANSIIAVENNASFTETGCLIYQSVGTKTGFGIISQLHSTATLRGGAIDNFGSGIFCYRISKILLAGEHVSIRNNTTGAVAQGGGHITNTTIAKYSGNTTDESVTSASYGYID